MACTNEAERAPRDGVSALLIGALVFIEAAVHSGVLSAARAESVPRREALSEVSVDIDRDGKIDRAVLVLTGGDGSARPGEFHMLDGYESVDLYIYLDSGDGKTDLALPHSFRKQNIDSGEAIFPLERRGKASISVTGCYGCGASKSWEELLTIAYRRGEFLIAGYSMNWDWNSRNEDGSVDTELGGCDINYLAGKGVASRSLDEGKPIKKKFKRIGLEDWTPEMRPKACWFE